MNKFYYGTIILICANVLVKIIGAIFKIPLTNLLGAEGLGSFSVAYNLYVVMFSVSTAGLPVAISKMVAEENANRQSENVPKIIKCALAIFFTISLLLTSIALIFTKEICTVISNNSAYFSIIAVAPSISLITIVSILRGYYQGHGDMTKTAISQVIEATFKLIIGFLFADYLIKQGYSLEIAAAGAIFGVTVGIFLSALYLSISAIFFTKKQRKKPKKSYKKISKELINIAFPITILAIITSLTNLVDMLTIMNGLKSIGVSESLSNIFYGAYNMSQTIYSLPQTMVLAISISIIPVISENFSKRSMKTLERNAKTALSFALIIALPCSVGFITLAKEILLFLYYKKPEDVVLATPVLVILGVSVAFVSITAITNALLQAMSKPKIPLKSISIAIIFKIIVNVILIKIPSINISGASFGTIVFFIVTSVLNTKELMKLCNIELVCIIKKPLISSIVMGYVILNIKEKFDTSVLIIIGIAASVYFVLMILIGGFNDVIKKEKFGER